MGQAMGRSSTRHLTSQAVREFVDKEIETKQIVIFSKSYCPFCKRAKALFASEFANVETAVHELDQRDDGAEIQDYLTEKTGQSTVPNIFVRNQHVGGNDDAQASFRSGRLAKLVNP